MQKKPALTRVTVQMLQSVRDQLQVEADKSRRSLSAEMMFRLHTSLGLDTQGNSIPVKAKPAKK